MSDSETRGIGLLPDCSRTTGNPENGAENTSETAALIIWARRFGSSEASSPNRRAGNPAGTYLALSY